VERLMRELGIVGVVVPKKPGLRSHADSLLTEMSERTSHGQLL
jgi:hypothetical protein